MTTIKGKIINKCGKHTQQLRKNLVAFIVLLEQIYDTYTRKKECRQNLIAPNEHCSNRLGVIILLNLLLI